MHVVRHLYGQAMHIEVAMKRMRRLRKSTLKTAGAGSGMLHRSREKQELFTSDASDPQAEAPVCRAVPRFYKAARLGNLKRLQEKCTDLGSSLPTSSWSSGVKHSGGGQDPSLNY